VPGTRQSRLLSLSARLRAILLIEHGLYVMAFWTLQMMATATLPPDIEAGRSPPMALVGNPGRRRRRFPSRPRFVLPSAGVWRASRESRSEELAGVESNVNRAKSRSR
jgi:hypothetical protein